MDFTPEQLTAIRARGGALLVSAGAGSGKTRVLVERLVSYVTDPADPVDVDRFLVITYTRAAAAELRERIGARLEAQGVAVSGFGRKNLADLPAAARAADWLILALPGDTGTTNFLDRRLLAKLPRRCVVVNVGRGNAVDEPALFAALAAGRLAGAYLDVRAYEPNFGNLGAPPRARRDRAPKIPNLVLMPHSCAFYREYIKDFMKELHDEGLL